jgi:hypothetical protein
MKLKGNIMAKKRSLGIPYVSTNFDKLGAYNVCPVCKGVIRLTDRKDFESFSGNEYARHFAQNHPND